MVREINVEELLGLMDARPDLVVIDCLGEESYANRHIPGAINIPFDDPERFRRRVQEAIPDPTTPLVTYCLNPECHLSPAAAQFLEERLGYTRVHEFPGGLVGWRRAGHELAGRTPRPVHAH